jgi:phage-related protein (TIGR01555 family)
MGQIVLTDSANAYLGGFNVDSLNSEPRGVSEAALGKRFSNNWIVRRICEGFAKDMTAKGVIWKCSQDKAEFLEKEFKRLKVWGALTEAVTWARLYGGSLVMFGMIDNAPDAPLNPNGTLERLEVFDRTEARPDLGTIRHGIPLRYSVSPRSYQETFNLDASRCIRFIGNRTTHDVASSNDFWGRSVIEAADTAIKQYDNSIEGAVELMKRCYLRWMGLKDFRQSLQNSDDDAYNVGKYASMVNSVQNISGLTIGDSEDTFLTQSYSFAGIRDVLMTFSEQVAGATHYPLVKLFGMSPSGFSTGDADIENYNADLLAEQEESLREPIYRIASLVLQSNGFGIEDLDFDFFPQREASFSDKVNAAKVAVDSILAVRESGIINDARALEEISKLGETTGIFATIDESDREYLKTEPVPDADDIFGQLTEMAQNAEV